MKFDNRRPREGREIKLYVQFNYLQVSTYLISPYLLRNVVQNRT